VTNYGFTFLQPLLDGKALNGIKQPANKFEDEILDCLRAGNTEGTLGVACSVPWLLTSIPTVYSVGLPFVSPRG
jgi:hypothetical protein